MWTWVLLHGTEILATGSWQGVIEAGEEFGAVGRRYREEDGFETCPVIRRGFLILPVAMLSEEIEERAYG